MSTEESLNSIFKRLGFIAENMVLIVFYLSLLGLLIPLVLYLGLLVSNPGLWLLLNLSVAFTSATIQLIIHLKYYIVFGFAGFALFTDWYTDFINNDLAKLADDLIRGVSYPVHMAYFNVQMIYKGKFHLLDIDQNTLFYFWTVPGLRFSTYYLYQFVVWFILPVEFIKYLWDPESLME